MNILKVFKGAKFDYDQIKEFCYQDLKFSNILLSGFEIFCYQDLKFSNFLFLTTLIVSNLMAYEPTSISMTCKRHFQMLKNDMCITEIGQAVLEF